MNVVEGSTCGVSELYAFEEDLKEKKPHGGQYSCPEHDAYGYCTHKGVAPTPSVLRAAVRSAMKDATATVITTLLPQQVKLLEPALLSNGFTFQGTARNPNTGNVLSVYIWCRPRRIKKAKKTICR